MSRLLALFIAVPVIELALLIEVGRRIGTLGTLALICCTGIAGAALARRQGLRTLRQIQRELHAGQLPGDALIDGALILLAGALLVTPGVLTDAFGFACLVPGTRQWVKGAVRRHLEREMRAGRIRVDPDLGHWPAQGRPQPPVVDVDARPARPPESAPPNEEPKRR